MSRVETRSMRRSRLSAKHPEVLKEWGDEEELESLKWKPNEKKRQPKIKEHQQLAKQLSNKRNGQSAKLPEYSREYQTDITITEVPGILECINSKQKQKEKKTRRKVHQPTPESYALTQLVSPVEDKNGQKQQNVLITCVPRRKKVKAEKKTREVNINSSHATISETIPKSHAITLIIGITALVAVIALSVIDMWHFGVIPDPLQHEIYENGLKNLQEDFKNQTERFWKILKSRGVAHLKKAPQRPLVLMFIAPPSSHSIVDCFARNLTANLDPEYARQLNIIDGKDYINSPGHVAKEKLDSKLRSIFDSGHQAALIHNLELFPLPSPLLFYSYCDNDNAPYKHVAILFTVHLPWEPDPSLSMVEVEGLVEDFLSGKVLDKGRPECDVNAVAALVSRISDTIVVLRAEDEEELETVCDSS